MSIAEILRTALQELIEAELTATIARGVRSLGHEFRITREAGVGAACRR